MKSYVPALALFLFACTTFAQPATVWLHSYGDSLQETGLAGVVRLPSGDILIAGDGNYPTPQLFDIHLTRLTADGDSVFMRPHVANQTQHAYACVLGADGNIAVAGSYSYEEQGEYYINSSLNIYDSNGNSLHFFGDASSWVAEALTITPTLDGGYLFAGYLREDPNGSTYTLRVVRLDHEADPSWTREYDIDDREEPRAIIALADGTFVIGGNTRTGDNPLRWRPFLLHIDADGNELNRRVFEPGDVDQFLYDMLFTPQGRLYIAGESYVEGQPSQVTDGFLTLLDLDYNPIATATYGGEGYDGFRCIQPLPDGDLLLVGHAQSYSGNWRDDVYVVRVNWMGEELWHGSVGGRGVEKGYGIVEVEGDDETHYIVTGTSSPYGQSWNKNVFAIRFAARAPWFELELVTAEDDTIDIPVEGGSFAFTANLANNTLQAHAMNGWIAVVGPEGNLYEPLRLSYLYMHGQSTQTYPINQPFPGSLPSGIYHYIGRFGLYPNTVVAADTLILRKLDEE